MAETAGLGWCAACGYCRSFEEDQALFAKPAASAPTAVAETSKAVTTMPAWVWLMVVGLLGVAVASYWTGLQLPKRSYSRALWCTVQVAAGLFLAFVAQFIALVRLAPHDETLSFKDALFPGRLWAVGFKHMRIFAFHFCLAVWGLALVTSAFVFVGGLDYWFDLLPYHQRTSHNKSR